jgi:hypothetical protein
LSVFGKTLFTKKATPKLYDFAQHGILRMETHYGEEYMEPGVLTQLITSNAEPDKKPVLPATPQLTPKEIYVAKTLNLPEFALKADQEYISEQVFLLKQKLGLLPAPETKRKGLRRVSVGDTYARDTYARQEMTRMITCLENRRKLHLFEDNFNEWPSTTNDAIRKLLSEQTHLFASEVTAMLPDLPKDAVNAITDYTQLVDKLCGYKPVFYLIAPKKAQDEVQRKRDPILLAQSPFGQYWQILGAWDEEVTFLDEL